MTQTKTKKALLMSVLSMVLCVAMLVGMTFAWFTDTASTAVNKIQAGKLDVELWQPEKDAKLEATNLKWVKANNVDETVLWEPGCKYNLESFRIKNNGNLALKYKVLINGLVGDAELLDVIDFTVAVDGTLTAKDGTSTVTSATDLNNFEGKLGAGEATGIITITGHMKETAGNGYMDKKIDNISITVIATQDTVENDSYSNTYDENALYPEITTGSTIEEVFGDTNISFGYGNSSTEPVTLDGKGVAVVSDWTDAWVNSDTTIKGVTFKNGAVFSAKTDNVTVTLEDCTFYACDQSKLTYTGNNSLTNSGAGMCLNLEKSANKGVKFIVKNCTFVGENDKTLSAEGPRYNGDGTLNGTKKRGHAIALDAICGGGTGTLDSLFVENCVINGVRGNAIQLYGKTGDITIKDTKINSWAVNNTEIGYAIRGDFDANGSRTLTIKDVYFGLDEISGNTEFGHVKVGSFSGNTNGTRTKGTY